jgi:hypothetical protein
MQQLPVLIYHTLPSSMDSFMGYSAGASVSPKHSESPKHSKSSKHSKSPRSPESRVHIRSKSAPRTAQPTSVDVESSAHKPDPEKADHAVLQDADEVPFLISLTPS